MYTQLCRQLSRLTSQLSLGLNILGISLIVFMMLLTLADVVPRYLFNKPLAGSVEITELALVVLIFGTVAYTQAKKGHIQVDTLISHLPEKGRIVANMIAYLFGLSIISFMTWQSFVAAKAHQVHGLTTQVLRIPVYPAYYLMGFGFFLFSLVLLADFLDSIDKLRR